MDCPHRRSVPKTAIRDKTIDKKKKKLAQANTRYEKVVYEKVVYEKVVEEIRPLFPTKESVELYQQQHDAHFRFLSAWDDYKGDESPLLCVHIDQEIVIGNSIRENLLPALGYKDEVSK